MVLRVVSQMTQQFGHSARCASSLARISALVFSSRNSLSSARNCLHVSKGVVPLALEEAGQFVAQLEARPQKPALNRRDRQLQSFGRLFRREAVHVTKREDGLVNGFETVDSV